MADQFFDNLKTVAHFIRKNTQFRASFIQNQIVNHISYKPVAIYRYHSTKDDGGFADHHMDLPQLNLASDKKIDINFRYLKKISKKDAEKILGYLNQNNVSILHLHYGSDACIYADVIKYSGIPSVVSFYGYDASSLPKVFYGLGSFYLNKRLFKNITKVLAMSPDMKKDLIEAGCPEEKIIVHYHGIDVSFFSSIEKKYDQKEKITLLILASLVPQKGHLFLLKSITNLKTRGVKHFNLRIVGIGELETSLKKFVSENSLDRNVTFIGSVKYGSKEMLNEFENADIFIHPSVTAANGDKEGIPGTIIEAMATGLPVISTYHAGIPFVIDHMKTGLLVKEWDVKGLCENMKLFLNDVELRERLGKAAQKFAREKLDLANKQIELENIYNSLMK